MLFQRISQKPFIKPCAGTIAADAVTTPDIVLCEGKLEFFLGAVTEGQEYLIHIQVPMDVIKADTSITISATAELILKPGPTDFDCQHIFDPAVIDVSGKTYLYYSAIGRGEDSIGVAIRSDDTNNFEKHAEPLLIGRSPEIVKKDGILHLFYVLNGENNRYSIYSNTSVDGVKFNPQEKRLVLSPGDHGEWDDLEVTTPRIIQIENFYYMVYAGSSRNEKKDLPYAFGIARSQDLVKWKKFPQNPVFFKGQTGAWDDGAVWFGTPVKVFDQLCLFYEGGRMNDVLEKNPALTQVGIAKIPINEFFNQMVIAFGS